MRYLFSENEPITLKFDSFLRRHDELSDGTAVASGAGGSTIPGLPAGHYLIEESLPHGKSRTRYFGVTSEHGVVMQLTVGAFTGDALDSACHACRVPVNYYVTPDDLKDSTMRGYQEDYGDAVYCHVMPNQLEFLDSSFAQSSADWESLDTGAVVERLKKLGRYMTELGFRPPRGFATYTPSNSLIAAMRAVGWDVLHSTVPEQNWSDGHWGINHWGMVNQPFYISDDDFRKPCDRRDDGKNVIGMTMNSYNLLTPHLTHWGDNVLSPSHFLRWHRTVEPGGHPLRFEEFFRDYLEAARNASGPFFLTAGFEFGRTFGVRSMTRQNREGMRMVTAAAKRGGIVFATGDDVADYYLRHCRNFCNAAFVQRDCLAGTRIMDKPIDTGACLALEHNEGKAVFRHGDIFPFYHYDYRAPWHFRAGDAHAPDDFAAADRDALSAVQKNDTLSLFAARPLPRAVPLALWDAELAEKTTFAHFPAGLSDEKRKHEVILLPRGFAGEVSLKLRRTGKAAASEYAGFTHPLLRLQTMYGRHYLFPAFPVLKPFFLDFTLKHEASVEGLGRPAETVAQDSVISLEFSPRKSFYRFSGIDAAAIVPAPETAERLERAERESAGFLENAATLLPELQKNSDAAFAALWKPEEEVVFELDCFGNCVFGEKSRAGAFDRVVRRRYPELFAEELSDGGISLGHHRSFWGHPRSLHIRLAGLDALCRNFPGRTAELMLGCRSFEPDAELLRYTVRAVSGNVNIDSPETVWRCPGEWTEAALFRFAFDPEKLVGGEMELFLTPDQPAVLDDWYGDGGFIAALERIAIALI